MHLRQTKIFGLIGYPLTHSFSRQYFTGKFEREQLVNYRYELFPLASIGDFPDLIRSTPSLCGLNVTIPYKEKVISFLDALDPEAEAVGAVNVIKFRNNLLTGYNSDVFGFEKSLLGFLKVHDAGPSGLRALVLGSGGASKAVTYSLKKLNIPFRLVSRTARPDVLTYKDLDRDVLGSHRLVINTTPLGTFPNTETCPLLPYEAVGSGHFFYDLVYNPAETLFLKKAKAQGAFVCNGLSMLHLQAERAWEIWEGE